MAARISISTPTNSWARFDELKTGQQVRFIIAADPDNPYRLHAEGIEILDGAPAAD